MKGSILLPLVQILLIIIISTLFCLGTYLFLFNNSFGPDASFSVEIFISQLPNLMLNIFPIVVLMSIVLSLINTLKTPANKGLAALFTLIFASLIYYAGYTGLYLLDKQSNPAAIITRNHLYEDKINPLTNSKLYYTGKASNPLAIEVKNTDSESAFILYKNADFNSKTNTLESENSSKLLIEPENPFFSEIFYPPELFKNLLDDLEIFNTAIKDIFEKSRYLFMITVLSQIAFAIGCWTIIKLSKWPFLNGLLAIAAIRLFPAYYRLSYSELTQKAIGFLQTSNASDLVPVVILLVAALLLFLWDLLFIKSKKLVSKNG
ncbi:MAG: hypothetical protein KAH95_03635 [Spirochaetales bacterium]|nr:hypothetical protein [Spirochaetales bacterium]